jgi:hypothetical protein
MINQYLNVVNSSFFFWAQNALLNEGQAYINYTSKLHYQPDPRLGSNYVTYSAPFKQWIYDRGVQGATICSGISGAISLNSNQSGLKIDYDNGRVILPSSFGTGLNISGSYSFKEFNFYLPNETEEDLLTTSKFYLNSRYNQNPTGKLPPYSMVTPAIFINSLANSNKGFALGGEKQTNTSLSMVVMAETVAQLNGAISFFTDKCHKVFPYHDFDPIGPFGDVKTGQFPSGFNYNSIVNQYGVPGNLLYIESVRGSKLSDSFKGNDRNFVGLIDFEISKERFV